MLLPLTLALALSDQPGSEVPAGPVRAGTRAYPGESVGVGPGYRVGVEPESGRWTFTPALGPDAAPARLAFELLEVGRGDGWTVPGASATVRTEPRSLELEHAGGWTETVELHDAGAKHTLVLDAPLLGKGDLTARFRVDALGLTPAAPEPGESLRWSADRGAVFLGQVLGVDAAGDTAIGSAHLAGDVLELRLPAAFVDRASYPLALDPLIGVVNDLDSGQVDRDADLAYASGAERFLSVWTVEYSASDTDTYAQRLDADGLLVGSTIILDGLINPVTVGASVGGGEDAFGVAWERFDGLTEWLEVTGIRASDGAVGSAVATIEAGSGIAYAPDLGGAADNGNLLCAYRGPTGQILGALVLLDGSANASIQPVAGSVSFEISSGFNDFRPAVSEQTSPLNDRWLVAWERFFSTPAPGDFDVAAVPVADVGGTVGGEALFFENIGFDDIEPACAPQFSNDSFVLLAAVEESGGSGVHDVQARSISSVSAGTTAGPIADWSARVSVDERAPSVAFNGTTLATAIEVEDLNVFTPVQRVEVSGRRPFSFVGDDPWTPVASGAGGATSPAVSTAWGVDSRCLLAFTDDPTGSGVSDVRTVGWRPATGGIEPLLDDACGPDRTSALAAFGGNSSFEVVLTSGAGSIANLLLISANRLDLPCGTCLIVPDPTSGPVINVGASTGSSQSTTLSIPTAAAGRTYYLQWLTADGSGGDCPELGVDLVRPLEIFID